MPPSQLYTPHRSKMNSEIKNTCECCGDETTEALTLYPACYPEPEQWICVECVEEDEESESEEWFDGKYPSATCHRCDIKVNSKTVVYCGGGGGACETWYCIDCHEDGTEDCCVCKK